MAVISLLAATGLRISEALALQVADLSGGGLLIRKTKFQKTRWSHSTRPPSRVLSSTCDIRRALRP